MARTASLSFPFLNLALVPEAGSTALLPAAIGLPRATSLLYFGEMISGEEAARLGMVTEAVDDDKVPEHAAARAHLLTQRAPQALALTRAIARKPYAGAVAEATQRELEGFSRLLDSVEAREALNGRSRRRDRRIFPSSDARALWSNGGSVATMESRLVDLEVRYTHLERQVAELSEVVFAQQRTIDGLLRQLSATKAEIAELSAPMANDKPPHY